MSGMQSSAMSTGMDTIWDLKINSSRIPSTSVQSAPRQHWQLYKGMNEITISSQFPPALPQRLLKRMLTSLWLTAVCVERKAVQGQTSTLKPAYNIRNVNTEIIHIPLFGQALFYKSPSLRSALRTSRLYFHTVISAACLLLHFYHLVSMLPLALPWTDPHVCPTYQTSSGLMVSPEQVSDKAARLQHRKQGLVLSCPPASTRDDCWDVS